MQACGGCGNHNRETARYCDQCGAALTLPASPAAGYTPKHLAEKVLHSRAAMVGERKPVTVLFADIKGSTRLAEALGAEVWHGMLNQFFAILSAAVHRLEGTVNQYTGDGIMALFGAPIAHEDHAARACFAALEMQRELRSFGAELHAHRGVELPVRIGLNTGEVVVGRIGDDLRMDYTAKGLTVNLAARMEQICVPGRINISRYTAAQIGGDFSLRDLGEQSVEGASHPIRVYELEAEHLTQARKHESQSGAPPLIGRIPELEYLQDALTAARNGNGRIVCVSGDAGIGKSRLCLELAQLCWEQDVAVHHAVCIPYNAAATLVPVRALLRSRLALDEHAGPDEVSRTVRRVFDSPNAQRSAVIPLIGEFLGAREGDAGGNLRSQMLERIARYLPQAARPQLLIVEDLQNADAATADFLQRLCEQIPGSPTLLLFNHRGDWSAPALAPFFDGSIELKPLAAAEVERMALGLLGSARGMQKIAAGLADRAQGNPFFVEEAVKALAETGHLSGEPGHYAQQRPIDHWPVPQSVHALIGGRIDRLSEEQKSLLQAASIIGRRFDVRLLAAYAGSHRVAGPGYFEASIGALAAGGFIKKQNDANQYEFCHPLTQEVAYQTQLESARAGLHAALAATLEERLPSVAVTGDDMAMLAHHWGLALDWQRAGNWSLRAAQWLSMREVEAALQQYRLAIQHLDRADYSFEVLRQRIAARAGLIRLAQFAQIGREEIDRLYDEAWRMAEEFQDIEYGAELLFSYSGEMLHRGRADDAVRLAADAASHARAAGAASLIPRFRVEILMAHNAAGRLDAGAKMALGDGDDWLQAPIDDHSFMARALYGEMCTWRGRLAEARAHLEASLAWAEAQQRECIRQCASLVDWAGFSGELEISIAHGEQASRLSQRLGSPYYKVLALRALGLALCHQRRCEAALRVLDEARPLAAPGGGAYGLQAGLLAVTAAAYIGLRKWAQAERTADAALASARQCSMRIGELQAWMVRLRIPGTAPGFAMEGIQRMHQLIEQTGAEAFRPWWLRAHARFTDEAESRALRGEAARLLEAMGAAAALTHRLEHSERETVK